MGRKDARIDAYIVNSAEFAQPILRRIRQLVHRACPDVEETMKWSRPFFQYHGILCGMSAFSAHCGIVFLRPEVRAMIGGGAGGGGVGGGGAEPIEKDGMGQFGRITSVEDLPADAEFIKIVKAAAKLNESGVKAVRPKSAPRPPPEVPPYFKKALKGNSKADAQFKDASPSKQREYLEWIIEAKTDATRDKRIATSLEWLAEGKSRNWKYEKC
jgi:hypothetical protein